MTAQNSEILTIEGRKVALFVEPLRQYLIDNNLTCLFEFDDFYCTGLWRGYVGHWVVEEERLYLSELSNPYYDKFNITLNDIFPANKGAKVFAKWYTGELRIPQGKLLEYVHSGYSSRYEEDLLISIKNGVVVSREVIDNRPPSSLMEKLGGKISKIAKRSLHTLERLKDRSHFVAAPNFELEEDVVDLGWTFRAVNFIHDPDDPYTFTVILGIGVEKAIVDFQGFDESTYQGKYFIVNNPSCDSGDGTYDNPGMATIAYDRRKIIYKDIGSFRRCSELLKEVNGDFVSEREMELYRLATTPKDQSEFFPVESIFDRD